MRVKTDVFDFAGAPDPPVVGSRGASPWVYDKDAAAGSPTVTAVDGHMVLALDATEEIQNLCFYMADELPYLIDKIKQVDFWAKLSAAEIDSAISVAFGVASARNDAIDSIAAAALFRCIGSNAVVCETDDGTNDNDDKAAGLNLSTTTKRFTIDLASGVRSVVPGPSVGGKAAVLFSMDNDSSNLRPVCRATQFDMSNYSSGLQLFTQIQKTSDTGLASLLLERIEVRHKIS